ncbi:hypothetical protein A6V36_07060 [Paraburkholderia ginsengiterrae]|uniref:Uncharacterized protein n=1 Tax=Paraburkholderia ginsengiterrae TaxID=1462993 RepID=A0ABX2UR30_9BURK|nr:hypothetical protein A6V36_07060 [Paraburkholderia ginsengiterrae]
MKRTVIQMDQGTQQNSALVEEAAAAATSLRNQTAQLAHLVAAFSLRSRVLFLARTSPRGRYQVSGGRSRWQIERAALGLYRDDMGDARHTGQITCGELR